MGCPEAQFGGDTRNGGFAKYILAVPNYVGHFLRNQTMAFGDRSKVGVAIAVT